MAPDDTNPFQVGDIVKLGPAPVYGHVASHLVHGTLYVVSSVHYEGRHKEFMDLEGVPCRWNSGRFVLVAKASPPSIAADPTNPKDAIGSHKVSLSLWPAVATAQGALALMDGARKYGRANYRVAKVRASIYVDAAMRHLACWNEGEEIALDSGVTHLGHALACLAILVDAQSCETLVDDRPYPGGFLGTTEGTNQVAQMISGAPRTATHDWTRADVVNS